MLACQLSCLRRHRSLAAEQDLRLKQQAWDEHLITTHWPAHNVTVFPALGKSYYKTTPGKADTEAGEATIPSLSSDKVHGTVLQKMWH